MTDEALPSGETRESVTVAQLIEQLRLAEARLARQRQSASGLNDTDRAAVRFILENSDTTSEVTPSVLATALHLTPPAMTSVVDRLVRGGFITVRPHPSDRRKKIIEPFDVAYRRATLRMVSGEPPCPIPVMPASVSTSTTMLLCGNA
jgi:DNA-binding MarR family transcriptional regulator